MAPPLACITWQVPGLAPGLAHWSVSHAFLVTWLTDPKTLLVLHNAPYDMGVFAANFPDLIPLIFQAYEADRVTDTQIRQKLIDIAAGHYRGRFVKPGMFVHYKYSLEDVAKRVAKISKNAEDPWRLRFGELRDLPLDAWPDEPKAYAVNDAKATLAVFIEQERHAFYLADQYRQARAALALHLSSCWGLKTTAEGVQKLQQHVDAEVARLSEILIEEGLIRPNGTQDVKASRAYMLAVCRENNLPITRTKAHDKCELGDACELHVGLDANTCEDTEDPILIALSERTTLARLRTGVLKELAAGVEWPVHTRYDLCDTGRTSSSKPPIQNLSRRPGVRECFVPREGHLFAEADFPGLELYTFAQCCISWFGFSKLAEALNAGLDPHLMMASTILRMPYAEVLEIYKNKEHPRYSEIWTARHAGKQVNFGLPGGMGDKKFIKTCRKQMSRQEFTRMDLTVERVAGYRKAWFETWPETKPHFARVRGLTANGESQVETLWTKRYRGGANYCATANNGFQALGSDCAKEAMWRVCREQYVDRGTPLFGTRTVAFIHDELILEVKDDNTAHDAAVHLARVMVEGANMYLPNVPIALEKMEPLLMRRWSKNAKSTFGKDGRLIPWV
jgi:DNA polymerase I